VLSKGANFDLPQATNHAVQLHTTPHVASGVITKMQELLPQQLSGQAVEAHEVWHTGTMSVATIIAG
jgi:hypothetical protein